MMAWNFTNFIWPFYKNIRKHVAAAAGNRHNTETWCCTGLKVAHLRGNLLQYLSTVIRIKESLQTNLCVHVKERMCFFHLQRKVLTPDLKPEQLSILNQTIVTTQNSVGECVNESVCVCVCLCVSDCISRDNGPFLLFQAVFCATGGRGFSPTWLPLMFHINHSLCTNVYVRECVLCVRETRRRGGAYERTLGGMFWNPWHRWLKPLITTQINSRNALAGPIC